jgi:uncharacterized membrane protein YidH (DUF202 family)
MESYGWLSEALFSGIILALAVWQWLSVRRLIARRKDREREALRKPPDAL